MNKHTPIPGYRGYSVTSNGCVLSVTHNWRGYGVRKLNQHPNSDGYPSVRFSIDGKRSRVTVHKLVALVFLPPRPSQKHQLRHLDGNKTNSHANNLAWGTAKDNADDRKSHGRTSRGVRHSTTIKASSHSVNVKRGNDHYETRRRLARV